MRISDWSSDVCSSDLAKILGKISGEAFLTPPGELSELVADAIHAETDVRPEMSTTGGTSDARFLHALCPVVEFGLINATMHKLDEAVAVEDLRTLSAIYRDRKSTRLNSSH